MKLGHRTKTFKRAFDPGSSLIAGEYHDLINRPPKPKKGPRSTKPKRKHK